jgi:UDP-N-acetylmuramate dehydrogenase
VTLLQDKLEIERACKGEVREDVSLKGHTSFHIGGPAALFVEVADADRLAATLEAARARGIATLILGGGTNLLVSDAGFDGLAIRIRFQDLEIDSASGLVRVGAGVASAELVQATIAAGLKGLEFAAGLPGTVGGAVVGNAGCFGSTFGERLARALVVSPGSGVTAIEDRSWFGFGYRRSRVPQADVALTEVAFALEPGDPSELGDLAAGFLEQRATRHPPPGTRTAGSYFKNLPPTEPGGRRRAAGELLDRVGAKQLRVGDAAVFERHANIVVNQGSATARDVLELTATMARRVQERFAVVLEPEVRFVGELLEER